MNNPFDYTPDCECEKAFHELVARLEDLKTSDITDDADFIRELESGKMLGILIASDRQGVRHTLYAFSGQAGKHGFYRDGFVGPVFDYLQPDGYFKTHEGDISRQNAEISLFENGPLARIRNEYAGIKEKAEAELTAYKKKCRLSKAGRDAQRDAGIADEAVIAAMTRQSQFEKAELHRLKKRLKAELEPFATRLKEAEDHLSALKEIRRRDSEDLQEWLFTNFRLHNAKGESRSLKDIFAETAFKTPPSGAGECCAPKLLQAAYLRGWHPESMAEYWYGMPKDGEVRFHGQHYPACRGKCLPVLGWMLRGLPVDPPLDSDCNAAMTFNPRIIYENQWFCVVDKPSGMLSAPGKGRSVSLQQWLEEKYGAGREIKIAHRLDQDTSGLIVATFGPDAYKVMQSLFATRKVQKTYVADLEGDYESRGIPAQGQISLPLSPDWLDRPRQCVDPENGKDAVTDYEFKYVSESRSRVIFQPHTGRTHQLRVHAASAMGLGMPIVGDRLYGITVGPRQDHLHLHAREIAFTFPLDGKTYSFESPLPF